MEYSTRNLRFMIVMAFLLTLLLAGRCYGMDERIFIIEGMTKEDAEQRLKSVSFRASNLETLKEGKPIELLVAPFWVAVGTNNYVIGVFNTEGNLLYSLRFNTNGQYSLYYDSKTDGLVVKMARSGTYYYFDKAGNVIKMAGREHPQIGLEDSYETDGIGNRYTIEKMSNAKDFYLCRYAQVIQNGNEEKVILECRYFLDIKLIAVLVVILLGGIGGYIIQNPQKSRFLLEVLKLI